MNKVPFTNISVFDAQMDTLATIQNSMDECDEINARSKKQGFVTPVDSQRHNSLLQKISLLKNGVTADDYRKAAANDALIKAGKRPIIYSNAISAERRKLNHAYRLIARGTEVRDVQTSGLGVISYQGGSSGQFVPVEFMYGGLQDALKAYSPLYDRDKVTFIETETGRPMQLPLVDDTGENATIVTEAVSNTTTANVGRATQIMNYTFNYRTPKILTSMEFGEDAMADFEVTRLQNFFAQRIARGVGRDMMLGNGSAAPLGLIPSLQANGVTPITAAGSGVEDGLGGHTGANSIGSQDLRNLYYSVDRPYRDSAKAAWIMADSTQNAIESIRDTSGRPLKLIQWVNGTPMLFGKPVYTDPNISVIAASQPTVVFGDLSHWLTRYVPSTGYVKRYKETPGVIEEGLIEWGAFTRFGGALLSNGTTQSALNFLMQHS